MNAAVDSTVVAKAKLYHLFSQLDEPQREKAREVLRRLSSSQSQSN
ncbi:hypothetical protein [Pararhizobium sp. PWRC1-1]